MTSQRKIFFYIYTQIVKNRLAIAFLEFSPTKSYRINLAEVVDVLHDI